MSRKRKKNIPYTLKTKNYFRERGYTIDDVERTNCWSGTKNDLFGFGDLLGIKAGKKPVIIQSTGGGTLHNKRKNKIYTECKRAAKLCLQSGFRIFVVSWRKLKRNRNRWTPRLEEITLESFRKLP